MKNETLPFPVEDRHPHEVGGHQVRGELHPGEIQAERPGQRLGERGFADAGHVFDQQMAASQQAGHGIADLVLLSDNDRGKLTEQRGDDVLRRIHDVTIP